MPSVFQREYDRVAIVHFNLVTYGYTDIDAGSNGPAFTVGDVIVSKDGSTFANPANPPGGGTTLPVYHQNGLYGLTIQATDLQCAQLTVLIRDQTGIRAAASQRGAKQWEDEYIVIETFGDSQAQHRSSLVCIGHRQSH